MKNEKMKNEKVSKEVKKEMRLNINFIEFVNKIKSEKLENVNKEKIGEVYESEMGLVFNNVKRVYGRVKRNMLKEVLESELKKRNMSIEEFERISSKIVRESKEKKNNYVSVSI